MTATNDTVLARDDGIYLRHPTQADCREYLELRRDSEAFHQPWEPDPPAGADLYSPAAYALFLAGHGKPARRERLFVCREKDDRILGLVNISEMVGGCFQSAYLGYWVGAAHANQRVMRRALPLVVRHAFESLGLHRLEANIRPENEPSIRLVRGAGFRREGYSPRYLKIDGEWRDHERWAILSDD